MKALLTLAAALVLAVGFTSCASMDNNTPSNLPDDGGIGDGVNPPGGSMM